MSDHDAETVDPLDDELWVLACGIAIASHARDYPAFRARLMEAYDSGRGPRVGSVVWIVLAAMIIQRLGHQPTVTDLARLASAKISDVHQLANIEQSELEAAFLTVYQFPTSTSLSSSRLFIVLSAAVGQFFEDPVAELGELRPYVEESG